MTISESDSVMDVSEEQCRNAMGPSDFTETGKVTAVSEPQSRKASLPIALTES